MGLKRSLPGGDRPPAVGTGKTLPRGGKASPSSSSRPPRPRSAAPSARLTSARDDGLTGTASFDRREDVRLALALDGCRLNDRRLEIRASPGLNNSVDIRNLPPSITWQSLKLVFAKLGMHPSYADVERPVARPSAAEQPQPPVVADSTGISVGRGLASGRGPTAALPRGNKPATCDGGVTYDDPADAQTAEEKLNGSLLGGAHITIGFDDDAEGGATLWVSGIPRGVTCEELTAHFSQVGPLAAAHIEDDGL
eukprot:SRR837773.22664.p1 GENE.SRR837773.22664~~SRR837773.22664.p1  ORF type:complete len:272 (+),score=27.80 SRR837773.22664:59-817(+)